MNAYAVVLQRTARFNEPTKRERTVTASAIDVAARKALASVRRESFYRNWRVTHIEEMPSLVP